MSAEDDGAIPQMGTCRDCGQTEPLYGNRLCGYCTGPSEDAVEELRDAFESVLDEHDLPTAFWSLDRLYNEYDGEIPNWEDAVDDGQILAECADCGSFVAEGDNVELSDGTYCAECAAHRDEGPLVTDGGQPADEVDREGSDAPVALDEAGRQLPDPDEIDSALEDRIREDYYAGELAGEELTDALLEHENHLVRDTTSQHSIEPDTPEGIETTATMEVPDTYCFTCDEWVGLSGVDLTGTPRSRKDAYYLFGPPEEVTEAKRKVRDSLADLVESVTATVPHIEDADEALTFIETEREQAERRLSEVDNAD